jgi:hypothetical protein
LIGVVSRGQVLGLEDVLLSKVDEFQTTAIINSMTAEFYRIEREEFVYLFK